MPLNMLNDLKVRAAKPEVRASKDPKRPDDRLAPRLTKLPDGGGLMLWIEPSGAKRWRMAYRFAGKAKSLAFGSYPGVTLSEAREARDAARKLLKAGIDPAQHKRATRAAQALSQANTFSAIAAELMEKKRKEGKAVATLEKLEWLLGLAMPLLGGRPLMEISAAEALVVLRMVDQRGHYETARKLRGTIGEVFRLAIATGRAENDPSLALRGALTEHKAQHHPAIIEPKEFGGLLRAIDSYDGQPETRLALQLLALTFVRAGELRKAEWRQFDLDAKEWVIPPYNMKQRREHRVPLAPQAVAILRRLHTMTGHGQFLFPSNRSAARCMSDNTINAALRYLGYAKERMCGHGFRSTASSMLNESNKWNADAIELQLAHVHGDAVRKAYNRAKFWDERVKMMAWWADKCDQMRADVANAQAA